MVEEPGSVVQGEAGGTCRGKLLLIRRWRSRGPSQALRLQSASQVNPGYDGRHSTPLTFHPVASSDCAGAPTTLVRLRVFSQAFCLPLPRVGDQSVPIHGHAVRSQACPSLGSAAS